MKPTFSPSNHAEQVFQGDEDEGGEAGGGGDGDDPGGDHGVHMRAADELAGGDAAADAGMLGLRAVRRPVVDVAQARA